MTGEERVPARRFGGWRRELGAFLELLAICGLAVAQPTFDLLGDNARLLIAWRATTADAVAMALVVVFAPPIASWVVEVVVGLAVPTLRRPTHLLLLGLWAAAVVVAIAKRPLDTTALVMTAVGLAGGALFVAVLVRFDVVRSWLRILAVAPIAFLVLFLVGSPATPVVFASEPAVRHPAVARPHRIVMIVLDEFPLESLLDGTGHVDAGLYPSFAALAGGATWYRNDTTVAPYTEAAVPAILSGQMPSDPSAVPAAADHPDNLFTLLGGSYALNVHESVTRLCPASTCPPARRLAGVHPGFGGMLRDVTTIWEDFATPSPRSHTFSAGIGGEDFYAQRAGTAFIRSLRPDAGDGGRPRLDFLHVLLPHFPWHYLPSGQDYASFPGLPPGIVDGAWVNATAAATARSRHLLQVGAVDALLGQVVARLRAIGAYDDTMIVVTADHGVAFRAHTQFRGVARSTYPSIMWTPLFVKYPAQSQGVVDDRPARSIDVLPTMAQVVGVRVPWPLAGRSLRGTARAEGPVPLFEWSSNEIDPAHGRYLDFDGGAGFRRVLANRAVAGSGSDPLRWYRDGPGRGIVGTSAWTRARLGPPVATSTLDAPLRYQVVDHRAAAAPWAVVHGRVSLPPGRRVVLAANGVVAGVYTTQGPVVGGRTDFSGMVAPVLRDGHNLIQLFAAEGSDTAPVLRLIRIVA